MKWISFTVTTKLHSNALMSHYLDGIPVSQLDELTQPETTLSLAQGMLNMQRKDVFTDLTLKISNGSKVKVHKVILSNSSDLFFKMLHCDMKESIENEVNLDLDNTKALKVFVKILYLSNVNFKVDWDIILQCFSAFHMYLMPKQELACSKYIISNLNSNNCLKTYIWTRFTQSLVEKISKMRCAKDLSIIRKSEFWKTFTTHTDFGSILDSILEVKY